MNVSNAEQGKRESEVFKVAQMKVKMGRPKKYTSAQAMERDIDEYFNECDLQGRPYTMTGLGMALNMDRQTVINYSKDEEFFDTINKAKRKVQLYAEERLMNAGGNTAGIIFALKNNYGWTDTQTIDAKVDETVTINVNEN